MIRFPSDSDEALSEASDRIVPIASRRRKQSSQALPNDSRPTIRIAAGEIERIVNEAESALINAKRGLYQQSNKIVSVVETPVKAAHGQEVIALGILERGDHTSSEDLSVAANFERFDKRCNDWVPADPPIMIVKTLKQRSGRLNFPILSGIVSARTMRDDGSILADTGLAGPRRKHSPERVSQEVELAFRHFADPCLLLVHRQLQLAHDLAQALQRRFGFAPSAHDHEIVGVGHEPRAEGSLKPEHLPSEHEPAHVEITEQRADRRTLRGTTTFVPIARITMLSSPCVRLFNRRCQPHLDQMKHGAVDDPTGHRL